MEHDQLNEWLHFACNLADEARTIAAKCRSNMGTSAKPDRSIVTEADHQIQKRFCEAIRDSQPGHAVLCEEEAAYLADMPNLSEATYCWVIDPLDGTRNYARGLPCCCTSIALFKEGRPVVGVIGDINSPDTFSAIANGGAWRNGERMTIKKECALGKPVVSYQPPRSAMSVGQLPIWLEKVRVRNLGSTAMHLAYVATGATDGAVCMDCRVWDLAAGALIVGEAGGVVTCSDGSALFPFDMTLDATRRTSFVTARPDLHGQLIG
ncbi:MAG: inositol monophosphatase [Planctomycetes bacterium]|nr:inositol monophosphatase [Planctomycetota bacterium]